MDSTHKVRSQHHQESCVGEGIEENVLQQLFIERNQQATRIADQTKTQTVQTGKWSSEHCELKETSDDIECFPSENIPQKLETDPQEKLLIALKRQDYELFSSLLNEPGVDPKFKYGKPDYTTLIELACRLPRGGKFVRILLHHGVKPNVHEILPEPIHYAAKFGNPEALEALLQHKKTKLNIVDSSGRTALHHAVRYSLKGKDAKYERCVELLLRRPDLVLNIPNDDGYTAVHEAANFSKNAVQLILQLRGNDVDLDSYRARGRTAREFIQSKYPELSDLLPAHRLKYQSFLHKPGNRL